MYSGLFTIFPLKQSTNICKIGWNFVNPFSLCRVCYETLHPNKSNVFLKKKTTKRAIKQLELTKQKIDIHMKLRCTS